MATLLDSQVINFLNPIFVFLLVYTMIYALLLKSKFFGDNKNFIAIIALAVSLMFLLFPDIHRVVVIFTPWFVILFTVVLFVMMFFIFLGVKQETILKEMIQAPTFITFAVIAFLVVLLVAIGQVYGPVFAVNQQAGFWNSFKRVVFHPKTLGLFFLLVVAAYTIRFLSDATTS